MTAVRWAGMIVIVAVWALLLHDALESSLHPRTVPTAIAGDRLRPGSAERFAPWASTSPDPHWSGCWLGDVSAEHGRLTLEVTCPDGTTWSAVLTHRSAGDGELDTCLVDTEPGRFLHCRDAGTVDPERRTKLLADLAAAVSAALPQDPFSEAAGSLSPTVSVFGFPMTSYDWRTRVAPVLVGALPLCVFLWLVVTGYFGFASPEPADWVAIVPFATALVVREALTLHSIEEIEIHFFSGHVPNKHSFVQPLLEMFIVRFARDPQSFAMHVNGILGAVASLPLYLFVRHRTASRIVGVSVALLFAVDPIVARYAPTDGPYGLIAATWFSALALLSTAKPDGKQLFAGAVLLGIAATCRAEGSLYLVASLFLLDWRAVAGAVRRHSSVAAVSIAVVAGMLAIQIPAVVFAHGQGNGPGGLPVTMPRAADLVRETLVAATYRDRVFMGLVVVGAALGVLSRRLRIGLGAAIGAMIIMVPMLKSSDWIVTQHRLVPVCALQCIAAGIGASGVAVWLSSRSYRGWLAAVPAMCAAGFVLATHARDLRMPYVPQQEYAMVRDHLVSASPDCTLLSFPAHDGDIDLHDYGQVVPNLHVVDCRKVDCREPPRTGGCTYYVRSLSCYWLEDGQPHDCAGSGACIAADCAAVERAFALEPIDERIVAARSTFPDRSYPETAKVGLYRVVGAGRGFR